MQCNMSCVLSAPWQQVAMGKTGHMGGAVRGPVGAGVGVCGGGRGDSQGG